MTLWPICWSRDDRWIFAFSPSIGESVHPANTAIFRVDSRDGRLERYAVIPYSFEEIADLRMSPDGRTIVLLHSDTDSDIWLVEDFDPEIR